jgi:phosphate uptake regulator
MSHLESAGDYVSEFSSTIPKLWGTGFGTEIVEAGTIVDNMQHRSISAFIAKDDLLSEEVVKMYLKFSNLSVSIKEKSTKGSQPDPNISILNCIYSMDRIAKCWVDIADLVNPDIKTTNLVRIHFELHLTTILFYLILNENPKTPDEWKLVLV